MNVEAPLRLKLIGVSKSFPGVRANDNVNLSVKAGEIHALLGENGAGKSTLVKMIYGILAPDEGEIVFDGAPVRISNPRAARRLGVGMVFQHFSLFEAMTVLENIALGLDARLSSRELLAEFNRVLEAYHLKLDPRRVVSTLSVGERQRIEIVRALLLKPRLLIMDEPTSVLTPQEVEQLFETLRKLAASGCSILYISHKLHEIVALCDTATILRGGKVVAHCDPKRETSRSMAEMMIGANLKEIAKPAKRDLGPPKLTAKGLSLPKPSEFGVALKDVALEVGAGEIFGVAGVAGNGQNELMSAMSGEMPAPTPEAITLVGRPVGRLGVTERRDSGPMRGSRGAQRSRGGRRVLAHRQWSADRPRPHGHGAIRPDRSGQGDALRRRRDRRLYGESDRARGARRLAFRRKLAEVHHGPRDPAAARGVGRLPADLGGGRGRGGRYPSGDRRSRRARLGGHGHLARPRRIARRFATRSPSSISAACRRR